MAISGKHQKVINDAWHDKRNVYLSGDGVGIRFQTKIVAVQDDHLVLNNSVTPEYIKQLLRSRNFYVQILLVNFRADSIDTDGKNILIPLNKSLDIKETRQSARHEFFPHRQEFCEFINPLDNQTPLRKRLMDFSDDGFSLVSFAETKLFNNGLVIRDIRFFSNQKDKSVTRSGQVKYIKTMIDINGKRHIQVGFEFIK